MCVADCHMLHNLRRLRKKKLLDMKGRRSSSGKSSKFIHTDLPGSCPGAFLPFEVFIFGSSFLILTSHVGFEMGLGNMGGIISSLTFQGDQAPFYDGGGGSKNASTGVQAEIIVISSEMERIRTFMREFSTANRIVSGETGQEILLIEEKYKHTFYSPCYLQKRQLSLYGI